MASTRMNRSRARDALLSSDAEAYCRHREGAAVLLPLEGVDSSWTKLTPSGLLSMSGPRAVRHFLVCMTVREAMLNDLSVVVVAPFAGQQRWLADLAAVVQDEKAWRSADWTIQVFAAGSDIDAMVDAVSAPVDLIVIDGVERLGRSFCRQLVGEAFDAEPIDPHDALIVLARRTDAVVIGCVDDAESRASESRLGPADRIMALDPCVEALEIDVTSLVDGVERTFRFRHRGSHSWTRIGA